MGIQWMVHWWVLVHCGWKKQPRKIKCKERGSAILTLMH
jgi:hypothetical protein